MSKKIIVQGPMQASNQIFSDQRVPIYPIYIEQDSQGFKEAVSSLKLENVKAMIITDSNVAGYWLDEYEKILGDIVQNVYSYVIPAGEENKNLNTIETIYEELIRHNFERCDVLFALGGGVIGDMTGYTAATYLRGIRFVQIPTSLLAMVDSSIGGKTGVDFRAYKNMVGAFHQPQAVYINLSTLKTLPDREFFSGFGEIIKHGYIKNADYLNYLQLHVEEAQKRDMNVMEEIIYESCKVKQAVVENDPTEKGERALLNFGHTIGHAVEKFMNFKLLHGECVALGIVAASYINVMRNQMNQDTFRNIIRLLKAYQLPVVLHIDQDEFIDRSELLSIVKHDKKMSSGQIRFVLLRKVGDAYIDRTVTDDEITRAISFIMGVHYEDTIPMP